MLKKIFPERQGKLLLKAKPTIITITAAAAATTNQLKHQEIMCEIQKGIATERENHDKIRK